MPGRDRQRLTPNRPGVDSRALMNRVSRKYSLPPAQARDLAPAERNEIQLAASERSVGYPIFGHRAGPIA